MSTARIDMPDPGEGRSFWLQEALAAEPADERNATPPLTANVTADVCIVGGGFAGLWTAFFLTERDPTLRIALLEQDICGGGASGRNGGFFSSSWWDLGAMTGLFGEEQGVRYALTLSGEVEEAEAWCETHGVDAAYHREGVLGVRTGEWQEGLGTEAAGLAARLGQAERIVPKTAEECRSYADSPRFLAGAFIKDSAICQPARLARGIRRVLLERGVHIFERTPMTGLERERPAVVRTPNGAVKAGRVVLTIGAWAASWNGFRRSFGNIADFMVATEPIPHLLEEIGWTSQVGIADGRDMLYYLRPTDDGRIAIGGGTTGVIFGGRASGRAATHDRHVAEVAARGLLWLFPQLEGIRFEYSWGGPIDQTASFMPFYRTLRPGNVHAGLGFSGHGLSQARVGGKILASMVLGVSDEWTSLPVVGPEIGLAPPEPLRWPVVRAAVWAMETGDAREDRGKRRGRLRELIGFAPLLHREKLVERGRRIR